MRQLKWSISFIFMGIFFFGTTQNKKMFPDDFGNQGTIEFSGEYVDSLLPEKGKYSLKWRDKIKDTLITYFASGTLLDHSPQGAWRWEEAGWDYQIEPGKTITPDFYIQGIHSVWEGSFLEGQPNGLWRFGKGAPSVNPRSTKTPLRIQAEFKEGKFINSFSIQDHRNSKALISIEGKCNDNGIAEGKWDFIFFDNGERIEESRTYDRGILIEIITTKNDISDTIDFHRYVFELETIKDSMNTVIVGERDFASDGTYNKSQQLYKTYIHDEFLCGWSHPHFQYSVKRIAPIFKRLAYPLSNEEILNRTKTQLITESLKQKIDEHLHLGNVNIHRNRNKELDIAISYLEHAQQQLKIIDSLIECSFDPAFIYSERHHGSLKPIYLSINQQSKVNGITYPEERGALPVLPEKQDVFDIFLELKQFTENIEDTLASKMELIQSNFILLRREGELLILENQMAEKLTILDSIYRASEGFADHVHSYWINTFLKDKLQQYTETNEYETALNYGQKLLLKMYHLETWQGEWKMIDSLDAIVRNSYTQFGYNPYTGAYDIELPIKRRFTEAIITKLIPWLNKEMRAITEWDEFLASYQQLQLIKEYLIDFSSKKERADNRVERRIRKESDPEKMLRIFMNHMD